MCFQSVKSLRIVRIGSITYEAPQKKGSVVWNGTILVAKSHNQNVILHLRTICCARMPKRDVLRSLWPYWSHISSISIFAISLEWWCLSHSRHFQKCTDLSHLQFKRHTPYSDFFGMQRLFDSYLWIFAVLCARWHIHEAETKLHHWRELEVSSKHWWSARFSSCAEFYKNAEHTIMGPKMVLNAGRGL